MEKENKDLALFEGVKIRQIEIDGQMFYSVIDVVQVLTDSPQPASYWNKVKKQILKESEVLRFWQKVKLKGLDGKTYPTDCANTEGVFRIIQSIPSPKAEPFKQWFATLAKQAIDESENPTLYFERMRAIYKAKGYTDEWIKNRMATIETRKELTDEWKQRGVKEGNEYSILTAVISKGTFNMTPSEYKEYKGLTKPSHELRDNMTNLELLFTALGEELTRQTAIKDDAQGYNENLDAAIKGGASAGHLRKEAEKKGFNVISKENHLPKGDTPETLPTGDTKE